MGQTLWPCSSSPPNLGHLWVGVGKETETGYEKSHTGCAESQGNSSENFNSEKLTNINHPNSANAFFL